MLRRIRTALADVPPEDPTETRPVARDSVRSEAASRSETARRFVERVAEYKAVVREVTEGELAHAIASACAARSVRRLLVPADLPQTWVAENVEGGANCCATRRSLRPSRMDNSMRAMAR